MRINRLWLLGFSFVATPLAAQTVVPAQPVKNADATSAAISKTISREAAIVNKMNAVNEFGTNGYDVVAFDSRPRSVRGTPFFVPGWAMGGVQFGNNTKLVSGVFKYDIANQQLRALRPQGDSIILAPEKVQSFTLRPTGANGAPEEHSFERIPDGEVPALPVAFGEAISTGNELRLLKLQYKVVKKGQYDPSYNSSNPVDYYQVTTQYFLRWADGSFVPVKQNQSSILAAVAQRQPQVAAAEIQTKSKARTEAELTALVQRMNAALGTK